MDPELIRTSILAVFVGIPSIYIFWKVYVYVYKMNYSDYFLSDLDRAVNSNFKLEVRRESVALGCGGAAACVAAFVTLFLLQIILLDKMKTTKPQETQAVAVPLKPDEMTTKSPESDTKLEPYITTGDVPVRSGPGDQYPVVAEIPSETKVNVMGRDGEWLRVVSKRGNPPGYINGHYARSLTDSPSEPPISPPKEEVASSVEAKDQTQDSVSND